MPAESGASAATAVIKDMPRRLKMAKTAAAEWRTSEIMAGKHLASVWASNLQTGRGMESRINEF
jgi:hypothetical protein